MGRGWSGNVVLHLWELRDSRHLRVGELRAIRVDLLLHESHVRLELLVACHERLDLLSLAFARVVCG